MRKDIKVSFKDNPDDDKLYDDIIAEGKKTFLGQSGFMKLAAKEKLERDYGSNEKVHKNKLNINQNGCGVINSCADLFDN